MAYLDPEFSPLPDGWTSKELQDVVEIHNTKRQPLNGREREGRKGSYPYCGANGVVDYIDDYRFDGEYVLIAEDGGYWGKHQPSSYIMRGKFWVNNHAHVVRAKDGETTNVFFSQMLNYLNIDPFIGGDARGKLTKAILTQLAIPLPQLPEQKKIAHILSTVQQAIEAQERIIQTTTELKKALMHKLFTEGLRHEPQKQTEIGPVPESWATPTVESACTIKASAMSYSQLEKAPNVSNGVRVIGIKVSDMNLPGNEIEFRSANLERLLPEKEARKRTVPADSIIFPKRGAAIATNKKRLTAGYTVLDPNLIAVMPSEAVNHRYLFHWFNTFDLKKITDPGPTPQLNKKDIAPLKFPMPPIEEQEAIAAAIDAAEEKATLHIRKRDQFQDLFRTLLHELMTAKTRVHKIEITV